MPMLRGDPAPWFTARSDSNPRYHFSSTAGHYVVLAFVGSAAAPETQAFCEAMSAQRDVFNDRLACGFFVSNDPADESEARIKERVPGIRIFWDFEKEVTRLCKAEEGGKFTPQAVVLDWRLRVLAVFGLSGGADVAQKIADYIRQQPKPEASTMAQVQAPVLVVPNLFEPEFCRTLIQHYQKEGGLDSGYMKEIDGKTVGVYDYSVKRRSDCIIKDTQLIAQAKARIARRLVPEIKKAFQFDATHIERYIVACYDSETKGFFNPHRDNTSKGTAHRKFAVTVNLNAEEFEGGCLRFPEFGQQLYKAPTGGAVVFSCALLHEATPVTRGTRYAFLPFLYDAEGDKVRQENLKYLAKPEEAIRASADTEKNKEDSAA